MIWLLTTQDNFLLALEASRIRKIQENCLKDRIY